MAAIELRDILLYVGDSIRPFKEGSLIAKSNAMPVFEKILKNEDDRSNMLEFADLCAQISNSAAKPHEIHVFKGQEEGSEKIILRGTRSCPAQTGKCKHIVGLILRLHRIDLNNVSEITCTDLTEVGKVFCKIIGISSAIFSEKFMPCSYTNISLYNPLPEILVLTVDKIEEKDGYLLKGFPNSMISTFKCATTLNPEKCIFLHNLINSQNMVLTECEFRAWIFMTNWSTAEKIFFFKIRVTAEEAIDINFHTINQVSMGWKKQRQVRITGTSVKNLYTYYCSQNSDYNKKLYSIVFPTFQGNTFTEYVKKMEGKALKLFSKQFSDLEIKKCGFIISIQCLWFGYSPDGFAVSRDSQTYLLEIKCPQKGKEHSGD